MAQDVKRAEKLLQAAQEATEGKEIQGLFRIDRPVMAGFMKTPWRKRPWVLSSPKVRSTPLRKALMLILGIIALDSLGGKPPFNSDDSAAKERASLERGSHNPKNAANQSAYYFGPAHSVAAELLIATQPRSKTRVLSLLCVTRDELLLLHVPDTRRLQYFANTVDVGWYVDRRQLEWTRAIDSRPVMPRTQYGFTDGSWMTLFTEPVAGMPVLSRVFPGVIPPDQPIPSNPNYPAPESEK
ncbi:hypothetical protein H181DRAFT_05275 [Streptomyces sp. WMMB 714]|uniref:hypothetical protein n=1 Tax=Streptomyces sp. WMMB 714 TaxID=1286822 RepID=UPI0005F7A98E|nr:hypothetical protein [Streptomyces sp. WMMB 714]SCK56616.1 hypothetical protein H181DRAFT_05275 [Streptomyces sp. WMMB 714]